MEELSRDAGIPPQVVRDHLRAILASNVFARSLRMKRFLEYIVEETLAGRSNELGEYGIGVAVFDRGANFEPMVDPIVRNDARRLRFKLLEYYGQEPAEDVVIEIPKGGYVPVFTRPNAPPSTTHTVPVTAHCRRVAVLPFDTLSRTPDCELGGRALCLSVTAGLTNVCGLEIVAHSCIGARTMADAASEFQLSHVIHGTIVQFGPRYRVIVNLIRVHNGTQVWAREYDSDNRELLAFQSEIARTITKEVVARLDLPRPQALALAHAA